MSTISLSLPSVLQDWVDAQAQNGTFQDAGDYLRDLIRRDCDRARVVCEIQAELDEGLASGISELSIAEVLELARDQADGAPRA